ncbi:hypothetical protein DNTS_026143 [Danionella cerebrum]|uniref:EGF-like domain-containing protein n=1 Tax=Danionella cerebrum TaxID=2873325 RepID=A0A553QVZ8_9TELE|nr:hypothetical protein DNTS_026143 [Danionella translucida]
MDSAQSGAAPASLGLDLTIAVRLLVSALWNSLQIPENGGLCDVSDGVCSSVRVLGQGFKRSYKLKCEVMKEKIVEGEWTVDDGQIMPATFKSSSSIECQLPENHPQSYTVHQPVMRWQIKVSNDGHSFSNAKILTLFDGTCQICTSSPSVICTLKNRTCSIDGLCYREGDVSPSSPCLTCRADLSKYSWSIAEKNEAPVFHVGQSNLKAFFGESFVYQFSVTDPEGSAVLFSLLSGPRNAALSPAGLLIWKALSSSPVTFDLAVTDDCNAETQAAVKVSVDPCECQNGASCVTNMNFPSGSGEYLCVCPVGFEGHRCEVDIDDCRSNPCLSGSCVDAVNSFSCRCPAGLTGVICDEDINECTSAPCYPGVPCRNTLGSFHCGPCPDPLTGDGISCKPRTVNKPDKVLPDITSESDVSFINPKHLPGLCSSRPCYPGVQCFESTYTSAGYICGPCPPGLHSNGQTCVSRTANRQTSQKQGATSSLAIPTFTRKPAADRQSPGLMKAKEKDHSSREELSPVEEQVSWHSGDNRTCADTPSKCRYPCGQNMECSQPNTCTCKDGYTGYNCHIAVCRPDCKNKGKCVKPNVCECPAGYSGPTCEEAICDPPCQHGGRCLSRNHCTCPYGYVGPRCETTDCKPVCLNGGTCIKPNTCTCPSGFYGSQCQIALCNPPCKNRGLCMRNNVCSCPEGYTGKRCQESVCDPMCLNNGRCVSPNICSCPSGWRGEICNIPVCLQTCRNGGECVGPNTCHCPPGWDALQCQTRKSRSQPHLTSDSLPQSVNNLALTEADVCSQTSATAVRVTVDLPALLRQGDEDLTLKKMLQCSETA